MTNKIFKNLKLGLAGLVLAGTLNQCTLPHLIALKKYTPLTTEQKDSLELNPGLREFLDKVYIIKKKDFENNVAAHTHRWDGVLCLLEKYEKAELLHESAHVRHLALNKIKSDFSEKWKQIANFEYGRKNVDHLYLLSFPLRLWNITWRDGTSGSKNGLLNPYSAKFMYEDIATFVESLSYVNEKEWAKKTDFLELYSLFFADTTDHRYQQKLDLLKEYGFFTKEEHKKLSKELGSLNYLLKENKK